MQIHQLQRVHPNKKRMTVARGGKRGKTSGRGGKGQSARAGNKRRPEWRDIIKKLPKLRGRGVNQHKSIVLKPVVVNLSLIEGVFGANDQVTPTVLIEKGVISTWSGRVPTVKILGDGDITKALKVSGCYVSESAKAKIEKAGGSVVPVKPVVTQEPKKEMTKPAEKTETKTAAKKETKSAEKEKKEAKPAAKKEPKEKAEKTEKEKPAKK